MMIDAPNHTLAARRFVPAVSSERPGALEWVLKRIQVLACGLQGHDAVLQFEQNRMFLRCTSCGHETTGWEVTPATFDRRRAEPRPARSATPGFGIVRKVA